MAVSERAKLFKEVDVRDSEVGDETIVGDFSRVRESRVGRFCSIDRQNLLLRVELGDRSYTGPWCMLFHCRIGRYCSISYGVTIGPPDHNYRRLSSHPFIYDPKFGLFDEQAEIRAEKFARECEIGNDVWIGCNATILRGVKVGHGAIIGANALVNRDVPPYAIVGGSPARVIRYRFSEEVIRELLRIGWWEWPEEKIRRHHDLFLGEELTAEELQKIE